MEGFPLIFTSTNSFDDLVFPTPNAYFYPYPEEKILFLFDSIKLWTGPHAMSFITSSWLSKNWGFAESHDPSESLLMRFVIFDN